MVVVFYCSGTPTVQANPTCGSIKADGVIRGDCTAPPFVPTNRAMGGYSDYHLPKSKQTCTAIKARTSLGKDVLQEQSVLTPLS